MKIVEIIWEDSFYNSGPISVDDIDGEPMPMQLTGYLVKETPKVLVLASGYIPEDGRWRHVNAIDKRVIKSRKVIRK